MKHIAPATIRQAPRTKYVHDAMTGRVITSRTVGLGDPFSGQWIVEAIASAFECEADDVSCVETDDGEFFVINGERVAYVDVN